MSQAKGKRGGKRVGAGRPAGSRNTLPLGAVRALKAARRLPEESDAELEDFTGRALAAVDEVLRDKVPPQRVFGRLRAAGMVLDTLCAPVAQKVDVGGKVAVSIQINRTVAQPPTNQEQRDGRDEDADGREGEARRGSD